MKRTALGLHKAPVRITDSKTTVAKDDKRHQETALDPIRSDWHIFRGPPSFTHVSLPAIYEVSHQSTNTFYQRDHVVRLTSPYQPFRGIEEVDMNTGAGTQTTGRATSTDHVDSTGAAYQTQWYQFYADIYKYYSVLACRYHVSFENFTGDKIYMHVMKYNKTVPPEDVSNHDMELWPDCKSYLSTPHAVFFNEQQMRASEVHESNMETEPTPGSATNMDVNADWAIPRGRNKAVITHSDQYEAGDTQQEIILDENVSTWTAVTSNPQLEENLLIRIKTYDSASYGGVPSVNSYGRLLTYNLKIKVEYLVEFRELQEGFRYPVRRNPIRINQVLDKLKNTQ